MCFANQYSPVLSANDFILIILLGRMYIVNERCEIC